MKRLFVACLLTMIVVASTPQALATPSRDDGQIQRPLLTRLIQTIRALLAPIVPLDDGDPSVPKP